MFAWKEWNLLQAFSCVPRVAPIMEMGSCFLEIPVLVDRIVQFIDVLKVHGVQEPCIELLPLAVRAVESWVETNCHVTAVKPPLMVKHGEGKISEAPVSELYSSPTLKQWENSLQYFRHASRSSIRVGDCLQEECLQGGDKEFKHGGEAYSLNHLLREAEDRLVNAVNPFYKLRDVWNKYAVVISMYFPVYPVCDNHGYVVCGVYEVWSICLWTYTE